MEWDEVECILKSNNNTRPSRKPDTDVSAMGGIVAYVHGGLIYFIPSYSVPLIYLAWLL